MAKFKHLKTFEYYLSENEDVQYGEILIDSKPYDVSQFNQNKYGVYIKNGDIIV